MKAHHVQTSLVWLVWSLRTGLACVGLLVLLGSLAVAQPAEDMVSAYYAVHAASQFKAAPALDCPRIVPLTPSGEAQYPHGTNKINILMALALGAYEPEVEAEELELLDKPGVERVARFGGPGLCGYYQPARCGPRNCVAACVTCLYDYCRIRGGSCEDCKAWMEECKGRCPEHRR
jgi:hypothetical protein